MLLIWMCVVTTLARANYICLRDNARMCLGVSGGVFPDFEDPHALQLKQRDKWEALNPQKISWRVDSGTLIMSNTSSCAVSDGSVAVRVAPACVSNMWTFENQSIYYTNSSRCLTVVRCDRKTWPAIDFAYCDSHINIPNRMSAFELSTANGLRGSYVKLLPCAKIPSQLFEIDFLSSASVSTSPSASPSTSPSASPSTSPSASPSSSPSSFPSSSPSVPSLSPSESPSAVPPPSALAPESTLPAFATSSPTVNTTFVVSTPPQTAWWVGLLVGCMFVLGMFAYIFSTFIL